MIDDAAHPDYHARGASIMRAAFVSVVLAVLPWNAHAAESRGWRVDHGDVRVVCPLTVGGSFEAKTSALTGTVTLAQPGPVFDGGFSVDLRTLDTGIGLRNDHLRRKYLEVEKGNGFEQAVVSDIRVGDSDLETLEGPSSFTGTLVLHGTRKVISGHATIRRSLAGLVVDATFPVTLADYGIPKPQYLGVGVKGQVQVRVTFTAVATP